MEGMKCEKCEGMIIRVRIDWS